MLELGKKKIASLVIGGMLLVGSVTGVAFADSKAQTTPSQAKGQYFQEFISDFATNLGVSQDKVTTALEATKKQMLQEAVQQGKLTQAQADKMATQKGCGFAMGGFNHSKNAKGDMTKNLTFLNNAASALGITADELKTELQSGKKLQQIVTDKGMTMEQFRQKMPQRQHTKKGANTSTNSTTTTTPTN